MMNYEQTERHPSNVGLTGPTLESGKVTCSTSNNPLELHEVFDNALRNATADEIEACLCKSSGRFRKHPTEVDDWQVKRLLQELKRRGQNVPPHNITIQEAIQLADHCCYSEIVFAYSLARAYRGACHSLSVSAQYGVCFQAGIIEGIRRERARRRRRQSGL